MMEKPSQTWRNFLFACIIVLVIILVILVTWFGSDNSIYLYNSKLKLNFAGSENLANPESYSSVLCFPDTGRPLTTDALKVVFFWNHTPYKLHSLTTSTLKSIGFTVRPSSLSAKHTTVVYEDRVCKIYLHFSGSKITSLNARSKEDAHRLCPFGISFDKSPEVQFPATRGEIEGAFGPPDKVTKVSKLEWHLLYEPLGKIVFIWRMYFP